MSKKDNDKHLSNIRYIDLTFDVSKLDKFNEVTFEHSRNISSIFSTFEVLKLDKSNIVIFEQL